ncbi:hypothetical protein GCM10023189_10270 [Nibrella saemangeumensis]|uniref:Uncharacterized protein n=1 Tax=Nibrella saemangeumensis TaxID=1084526 RepID=A0ABP8MJS3_9BACT
MAQSQFATALIDETINTFNGSVTTISPMDGIALIDNWVSALHSGDASTNPVANTLSELKLELQSGNPKTDRIEDILDQLVEETRGFADSAEDNQRPSLNMLAAALDTFRKQLAGESGPANTGGNAPGGGTVSGMSTTSVRQPGANDAGNTEGNDQDQSNDTTFIDSTRSGTVDSQTNTSSTPGGNTGDETAEADGNTQGGGSYGSGYGTGSTQEEGTSNSGTETGESSATKPGQSGGRIGGHGISGGESDEETGSSSNYPST